MIDSAAEDLASILEKLAPGTRLGRALRLPWRLDFRRLVRGTGLPLREVARALDVPAVTVRRWHAGSHVPAAGRAAAVLRGLLPLQRQRGPARGRRAGA